MNQRDDFIEIDPDQIEVEELRSIISGEAEEPRVPAAVAVGVLRRKVGNAAADEIAALAREQGAPLRVRQAAVSELAKIDREDVPRLMEHLLDDSEPAIVRAALSGLGRCGDAATLALLKHRPMVDELRPVKDITTVLIEVRTGEEASTPLSRYVSKQLPLGRKAAEDVEVVTPQRNRVDEVMNDLADLRLPLLSDGAIEFRCGERSLLFLATTQHFVEQVGRQPSIVGVVAGFEAEETGRWEAELYAVIDGRDRPQQPQVQLRAPGGQVVFSGEFDVESGRFRIGAEDRPGATPIEAIGRYVAGDITIDKARTGVRSRGAQTPQRL